MVKEITLGLRQLSPSARKRLAIKCGIKPITLRGYIWSSAKNPSPVTAYLLDKHSKGAFKKEDLYPKECWFLYED